MLVDIDGTLAINNTAESKPLNGFNSEWAEMTISRLDHPEMFTGAVEQLASINRVLADDAKIEVAVDLTMLSAFSQIASRPHVECKWLTMWEDKAVDLFAPFTGLGEEWDVLKKGDAPRDWKLSVLDQVAGKNPDTQIIFLDDDVAVLPSHFAALEEIVESRENVFVVVPTPHVGLTAVEVGWISSVVDNPNMVNALLCE